MKAKVAGEAAKSESARFWMSAESGVSLIDFPLCFSSPETVLFAGGRIKTSAPFLHASSVSDTVAVVLGETWLVESAIVRTTSFEGEVAVLC